MVQSIIRQLAQILWPLRMTRVVGGISVIIVLCFCAAVAEAQTTFTPFTFSPYAHISGPISMAVDGSGNVYVAAVLAPSANTIQKISPGGAVTTLAGAAGVCGSTDGTGSGAQFCGPAGVAVDGSGNVYVADQQNCTIRKVTSDGVVTTLAVLFGSPAAPTGVAVDTGGNVYVADLLFNTIYKITPTGVVTSLAGMPYGGSFCSRWSPYQELLASDQLLLFSFNFRRPLETVQPPHVWLLMRARSPTSEIAKNSVLSGNSEPILFPD